MNSMSNDNVSNNHHKMQMTENIRHHPSHVSECRVEDWRCKMAGMAMHLSLGSLCINLYKDPTAALHIWC